MILIDWLCLFVLCFDEVNSDGNKQNTSTAIRPALDVRQLRVLSLVELQLVQVFF